MKEGAGGEKEDPQECDKGAGGGSEDLQGRDKGAGGHRCFGADWGQCQEFQPVVGNLTTKWVDLLPLDCNLTTGWISYSLLEILMVGNLTTGWKFYPI